LSVPKRPRWHLTREPRAIGAVLHILLRVIEGHLRQGSRRTAASRWVPRCASRRTIALIYNFCCVAAFGCCMSGL
jgi:hypothetical protein